MKQQGEELSTAPCQKCGAMTVYVSQPDDWSADYTIRCDTCGRVYRVDGDDG